MEKFITKPWVKAVLEAFKTQEVDTLKAEVIDNEQVVAAALNDLNQRINEASGIQSDWNELDSTSAAYIQNKPTIPSAVTETTVSGWGFTKNTGTYSIPSGGIPASDLASGVIPDISVKENKMTITTANGTTLSAAVDNYYRFDSAVGTLTVTLPTPLINTYLSNIIFSFTTSSSPNVTFTSGANTIKYSDGFEIEASTMYEINALWNGTMWILGMMRIEV